MGQSDVVSPARQAMGIREAGRRCTRRCVTFRAVQLEHVTKLARRGFAQVQPGRAFKYQYSISHLRSWSCGYMPEAKYIIS